MSRRESVRCCWWWSWTLCVLFCISTKCAVIGGGGGTGFRPPHSFHFDLLTTVRWQPNVTWQLSREPWAGLLYGLREGAGEKTETESGWRPHNPSYQLNSNVDMNSEPLLSGEATKKQEGPRKKNYKNKFIARFLSLFRVSSITNILLLYSYDVENYFYTPCGSMQHKYQSPGL